MSFDQGATLAARFRAHAADHQHLYGVAMRAMADDWEAGGPVRAICAGWEDAPPGTVVSLRLLGGLFRLVLAGRADALRPWYACLAAPGEAVAPPATVWPVLRTVLAEHIDELRDALETPPQTNEVGRAVALLVGLADLLQATGTRRVRLLELGASAGLNLLLDRFRVAGDGWAVGPEDSLVQLLDAVVGPLRPPPFTVVDRAGCDLYPVDATTPDGARLLTSFVWPFDLHRHARLAAALQLAHAHPVRADRAPAGEWLPGRLAAAGEADAAQAERHGRDGVLTVVWHSITQLYWPPAEVAAVDALLAEYGARHRVAEVALEYPRPGQGGSGDAGGPTVSTRLWRPGVAPRERAVAEAHDHGIPVRLLGPEQDQPEQDQPDERERDQPSSEGSTRRR